MNAETHFHVSALHTRATDLALLARSDAAEERFWPLYLESVAKTFSAQRVLILMRQADQPWQALAQWPTSSAPELGSTAVLLRLADAALGGQPVLESEDSC